MRFHQITFVAVLAVLLSGCSSLIGVSSDHYTETPLLGADGKNPVTDRFGRVQKQKTKKRAAVSVAESTAGAIDSLKDRPEAFLPPTCAALPDGALIKLDADQILQYMHLVDKCQAGLNVVMGVAVALDVPLTTAGKVSADGFGAVAAVEQQRTMRTKHRIDGAKSLGLGYFGYKATDSLVGGFAAVAATNAKNPNIQVGSINQSSSRHSGQGGGSEGGGEGAAAAGAGGSIDGTSLNQLIIGSNNATGQGTDSARTTPAANNSVSTIAEPSSTVATFQSVHKPQANAISDEPIEINNEDGDGGQKLF